MSITKHIYLVLVLIIISATANATDELFANGRTSYGIVISRDASITEQKAATELKDYLGQISGATFTISSTPGKRNIYVGYDKNYAVYRGVKPFADDNEGFAVKKVGSHLVIYGGRERGTMYGVFRFLQEYLGVQWYTPDYTKVLTMKKFTLDNINLTETPKVKYRYTDFFCAQDIPWMAHNMMNTRDSYGRNTYGIASRYWGTHTMGRLLPASKYFKDHPEYFAYRKFHRVDYGQPCLSNPDVLKIITREILSTIQKNPSFLFYDVSQNDNQSCCTCKKCVAIENQYGGHSGLMIWFVNQVAREVKKKYPNKFIGTFAYQYTRHAPKNIRPESSVVIRLCDIECCLAHPLSEKCNEHNAAFMKDLKEWSRLTDKIYIWDYIVNYSNYMAPFPNFRVLGPNLKTFAQYNAIGVFEEAQGGTLGNSFEELKSWIVGQLMWNPEQDTDKLVSLFIRDYYGKAAADVQSFYNLCQSLVSKDTHLTCHTDIQKAPYTDKFTNDVYRILNKALSHAENGTIAERVRKLMMQPQALECARHPKEFYKAGKWPGFKRQIQKYKACFKIHTGPDKFISTYEAQVK